MAHDLDGAADILSRKLHTRFFRRPCFADRDRQISRVNFNVFVSDYAPASGSACQGASLYASLAGEVIEDHNLWDTLTLVQQIGAVGPIGQTRRGAR